MYSFRRLLKAARVAFLNDKIMYEAASKQAKSMYRQNKDLKDIQLIKHLLKESDDAAEYMFHDIARVDYDAKRDVHSEYIVYIYTRKHIPTYIVKFSPQSHALRNAICAKTQPAII